jgi:hypothetical protein
MIKKGKEDQLAVMDYSDILKYVDAACTLAESLERDITKSARISTVTIVALNQFMVAAKNVQPLLDMVEVDKLKLN